MTMTTRRRAGWCAAVLVLLVGVELAATVIFGSLLLYDYRFVWPDEVAFVLSATSWLTGAVVSSHVCVALTLLATGRDPEAWLHRATRLTWALLATYAAAIIVYSAASTMSTDNVLIDGASLAVTAFGVVFARMARQLHRRQRSSPRHRPRVTAGHPILHTFAVGERNA
jgi:hypothetical protein